MNHIQMIYQLVSECLLHVVNVHITVSLLSNCKLSYSRDLIVMKKSWTGEVATAYKMKAAAARQSEVGTLQQAKTQ